MACTDSLKPFFDWIKQSTEGSGFRSGQKRFPVYLTLTIHSSTVVFKKPQPGPFLTRVEYLGGEELKLKSEGSKQHLHGEFSAHVNLFDPKNPDTKFNSVPKLKLEIKVFPDGSVSILRLTDGKPLLGQGPVEFKGTCTKGGLLTGVFGERSYTLSFVKGKSFVVVQ